jgi:tetratricopeptide (TPR) repeat protein
MTMTARPPDTLARFARLPRNPAEVWQAALIRLPAWVEKGPDGKPYRPNGAFCVSLLSGRVNQTSGSGAEGQDPSVLLDCVLEFGLDRELCGCRPGRIEVADERLAVSLEQALAGTGVTVTVSPNLPELNEVLKHFGEYMNKQPLPPNALDVPGVTVEQMRAFAVAAGQFHAAAPWRHLTDEDLVKVEAPDVPPSLTHFTVMGGAGLTFGIGFYSSREEFEALLNADTPDEYIAKRGYWSVLFGPIQELPFGDADLWQDHGLPVAGDGAYPIAAQFGPGETVRRPDATVLASLEALLLAVAHTTEAELDAGRWTKRVETSAGIRDVRLSIAALLEPLDAPPKIAPGKMSRHTAERVVAEAERFMADSAFENPEQAHAAFRAHLSQLSSGAPAAASTPLERAQEMVERAYDSRGRRRIQLARKALEVSPDCADAYTLLAEEAYDPEDSLDVYRKAVAAGERAVGPDVMQSQAGRFWGLASTRPYMRALFGLGQCLAAANQPEEAIRIYGELLRLNPQDNQGVRLFLFPALLESGRDADAGALLQQFAADSSAQWQYGWALWLFRTEGDSPSARERLQKARRANRYVPDYLSGKTELPEELPDMYEFGSKEEAMLCADALLGVWQTTPAAGQWLRHAAKPEGPPKKRRRR